MRRILIITLILLGNCKAELTAQRTTPVIRQVDHVLIECRDPQRLFSLFADTLQLPVAWPLNSGASHVTGGIGAGNINIEFFAYTQRLPQGSPTGGANYYGIAFEPYPLGDALRRLKSLAIPYNPPEEIQSKLPNGSTGIAWTTVALPSVSRPGMSIFLYEYSPAFLKVDVRRKQLGNRLLLNRGGPLGVQSVREIIIGSAAYKKDMESWSWLIGKPAVSGEVRPLNGPAIRIIPDDRDRIREIVFTVESLGRARAFLAKNKLLGSSSGSKIYLSPTKLQGLSLSLASSH